MNFKEILTDHEIWLNNQGGKRANLTYADLRDAELTGANLTYANLTYADLRDAELTGANLRGVNLRGADLTDANLRDASLINADLTGANLRGANLTGASLRDASLRGADLTGASLRDASLRGADLRDANLRGADLRDADLTGADLRDADLTGADLTGVTVSITTLFYHMQCPEEGAFVGWKRCRNNTIVKLLITEDAKRSSATSRKCRCSKAKVLNIYNDKNEEIKVAASGRDENFIYEVGEIVEVNDFDDNRWNECSTGIHFFITRNEAEIY